MKDFFINNQVNILACLGVVCGFLAFFALVIDFQSYKKKLALIKIEIGACVLLISDALSYMYNGNLAYSSMLKSRIVNFLVFFFTCANILFLNEYITTLFMSKGKYAKLPKRLVAGFVLPGIGLVMVIISQFTNWYYYLDELNVYHRGPLYLVSFVIPFITLMIQFSFIIENRKLLNRRLFTSVLVFSTVPIIAALIQLFIVGFSMISAATAIAAICLFGFALVDLNKFMNQAVATDVQTGMPNSYGYLAEIERVMHTDDITQYNGFYFDIVRMSRINNKYGKILGDEVIKLYAEAINKTLEKNEILGRLGGNYFVALVKKQNTEQFLDLLMDVPVEIKFEGKRVTVHVAATVGGYSIKSKHIPSGQILGKASEAVAYAKNVANRPCVFMDEQLEREIAETRQIEEKARKGLDNNEFMPFYQPKVDSETQMLIGCEALARWKHENEMISPGIFVPVMEKNGSISELDFQILELVCKDMKAWMEEGLNPPMVSVNLSRKNLADPFVAERINNTVKKYEIPPELIQIEVTETVDEFPLSYLISLVEALQKYGMSVAIDDFGTGSSSINLLKQVHFDMLKIDRAFVEYKDEQEKQVLYYIIQMAKAIGIDVIAEGVEQPEQINTLADMGCTKIQGFVYDRPMDRESYEERIKNPKYQAKN